MNKTRIETENCTGVKRLLALSVPVG